MIKNLFNIFWRAPGARPVSVTLAMCFSSLSDLLGMGALLPLVSQLSSDQGANNSILGRSILEVLSRVGLSSSFTTLLIVLGTALLLKSSIAFLSVRFVAISVANIATELRTRLLKSTLNARWSYFVDHQPGEVAAMVASQAQIAADAYMAIALLVVTMIMGFGLLVSAILVSGALVIFCFAAISALAFPLYYILRRAQAASLKQFDTSNKLASMAQDVIANMKPLKSMGKQGQFIDAFMKSISDLHSAMVTMLVARHSIYHGQDMLGALMIISGVYAAVEILHTPMSQLLVVGIIFYQLIDVVKRTQLGLQDAVAASAAYNGVSQIISNANSHVESDTGTVSVELNTGIKLERVSFAYDNQRILTDINMTIPAKGITVLVGQSGSGKTTLVDLIVGFYRPQEGCIKIDGVNLNEVSLKAWRNRIGYVPQELTLLKGNILDNIALGDASLTLDDVNNAIRLAGAREFISALPQGVHTDIGTMGAKLSGGQRQRISLARALVHKPQLLLLDEVTSALDEATENEICENIGQLLGQLTIIAITHRPAWTKIATKLYVVTGGQAVEMAPRN